MKNENAKHMPGPWRSHLNPKGHYNIIDDSDNCPCIAQTLSGVNEEANARLLTAAPELLAALEEVRDMLESSSPTEKRKEDIHFLVVAALMKAKGE